MAIWYPSVVVHLRIRFDEAFHVVDLPPARSAEELAARAAAFSNVSLQRPLFLAGTADKLSHVTARIPKSATIELGSYRQGGKFSLAFEWKDLPIDPRLFRACGVEIHVGAVNPEDFGTGMVRLEEGGRRKSILRTTRDTLSLVGVADEPVVRHGRDGSEVTIEGRDQVAILADSPIAPKMLANLDLREPIHVVVAQIVAHHPYADQFIVTANEDDWPGGKVTAPGDREKLTRVRRGADGEGAKAAPAAETSSVSFWDLIVNYCNLVGAVPYFDSYGFLRIRPGRSLYDHLKQEKNFDPRVATPFLDGRSRTVDLGQGPRGITYRRMIFGRNVKELTFRRKLGGVKPRVVEVISLDTSSATRGEGKLLIAQWPPKDGDERNEAARVSGIAPSGKSGESNVIRISRPGIRSLKQLTEIAKDLFEEIMRHEVSGTVETDDLASFGGTNEDPDLTRLRPGDPVELLFDAGPLRRQNPHVAEVLDHHRRGFDEEVAAIAERIGDEDLARAIVGTARNAIPELQTVFRVGNVRQTWNATADGQAALSISFDFSNYIEARSGVTPSTGPTQSAPVETAVGGRR